MAEAERNRLAELNARGAALKKAGRLDEATEVARELVQLAPDATAANMNLGFDRNRNFQNRIYYKTATNFTSTSFQGALMMRPVMVSGSDPFLGVEDAEGSDDPLIFPNPTADQFRIRLRGGLPAGARLLCFDPTGRLVMDRMLSGDAPLDASMLTSGIYLLRITDASGAQLGQARLSIER